jgi:Bacteriophage baseplate protein W
MEKDFLGVGFGFPLKVEYGKVIWSEYEESIRESILLILGTVKGERVMRPDFGCGIHELVFSANNISTATLVIFYVEEALKKWEPRIKLINVDANPDNNKKERMNIDIEYKAISTNTRYNLVYPFYLGGG